MQEVCLESTTKRTCSTCYISRNFVAKKIPEWTTQFELT